MLSTIGIIIDVAIVAFLVIFAIIGYKKGFLKTIISFFSWTVCLGVAIWLARYVAGWINKIYDFTAFFGDKITNNLINSNNFFDSAINSFSSKEELQSSVNSNTSGILNKLLALVFKGDIDMTSELSVGHFAGYALSQVCVVVVCGILTFIVLRVAVMLLTKLFDNIERTKVLGGLNKILGSVLGVVKVACVVVMLNAIVIMLTLIPAVNNTIKPLVQENTYCEKVIYNACDKFMEKYVINGNIIQNWITDAWTSR